MAFDAHVNFGYSTVATSPSPASSGTSLVVASGEGADFPPTPFNAVVWPAGANPRKSTAEVVRVTNISTDTFTITRAQETSPARTIVVGDQIADAQTAKSFTDIEGNVDSVAPVTQDFGDAAASGSSAIFARRDHKHGMPAIPIGTPQLVYRYTVAGSDKASIDTGADTADAGSNDWTDGDVLEVWITARTDEVAPIVACGITLNNDGSSIYDKEKTRAVDTGITAAGVAGAANWPLFLHASSGSTGYPGAIRLSIPDFAGTTFWKVGEAISSVPDQTAGNNDLGIYAVGYRSTSAITRLAIAPTTAGKKFKVGSQLLIYKRKAS